MRSASWEPTVGALATFLASGTLCVPADLFTITLANGTVLRYTSLDQQITVNGNTFVAGPTIKRNRVHLSVGISVDTLTLDIAANSGVLVGSVPLLQALAAGAFTGARVVLERVFYDTTLTAKGTIVLFPGRVGQVQVSRTVASIEVLSDSELLDVMVPAEVYQPGCRNSLYDAQCQINKASWTSSITCNGGTDATRLFFLSNMALANGGAGAIGNWAAAHTYDLGTLVGVTGPNAGVARTIKTYQTSANPTSTFFVISPWPYPVSIGDAFALSPGCDKTWGTCGATYSNTAHFRAEPEIPAPETVI
jgi:uncharacterized phage protein (TIGR02218 family)